MAGRVWLRFPVLLLLVALPGCSTRGEPESGQDPPELPLPQRLGWERDGRVDIPAMRIGDVYRVTYDVEWHGSDVAIEAWRVRAAPGEFVDRTGARFRPPAVLERWDPGSGEGEFLVLDPAGRIMATLSAGGSPDEDLLPVAWRTGEVHYGPYGLAESTGRLFLFLGLSGRGLPAEDLVAWEAYLTTYETYARSLADRTIVGAIGFVRQPGTPGPFDDPIRAVATEYQFDGAPVPSSVWARHGLGGSKLGEPGLLAKLTGWEAGQGARVDFGEGTSRLVLAEGRAAAGSWLPAEGMPVELPYEEAVSFLRQNSTFLEWTQAHPDFWMTSASYDDFWVESADEAARPKWWLRFGTSDQTWLATRVSFVSDDPAPAGWLPVRSGVGHRQVDYFRTSPAAEAEDWSQVPHLLPLERVLPVARSWAADKPIVDHVSMQATTRSSWGYRFPPEWPDDLRSGSATACFTFRAPGAEQRFGVTNVHVELTTGWITHADLDADASHC